MMGLGGVPLTAACQEQYRPAMSVAKIGAPTDGKTRPSQSVRGGHTGVQSECAQGEATTRNRAGTS